MSLRRLQGLFDRSERALARGVPIRKTAAGIWVPSAIPQIVELAALLREMDVPESARPAAPVVDAGMGDGRVVAVLAHLDPARAVYGIERDPVLYAQAAENLRSLREHGDCGGAHLVEGDYCDPDTYASCGIDLRAPLVVLNYPDGNEHNLARFLARHAGPDAALCLFTHDRTVDVGELRLRARRDLPAEVGPDWRLSIYRGLPGG